jgi:hypothetical protein
MTARAANLRRHALAARVIRPASARSVFSLSWILSLFDSLRRAQFGTLLVFCKDCSHEADWGQNKVPLTYLLHKATAFKAQKLDLTSQRQSISHPKILQSIVSHRELYRQFSLTPTV